MAEAARHGQAVVDAACDVEWWRFQPQRQCQPPSQEGADAAGHFEAAPRARADPPVLSNKLSGPADEHAWAAAPKETYFAVVRTLKQSFFERVAAVNGVPRTHGNTAADCRVMDSGGKVLLVAGVPFAH